MLKYFTP